MVDQIYGASPITRHRRTREEIAGIEHLILGIVAADHPMTLRGLFYRLVAAGVIAKAEREYKNVGRYLLALRRRRDLPSAWIADSTRWQRKPRTFRGLDDAFWQTARAGHWHTCPRCRGDPDRKVSGDLADHSGAATGHVNGASCQPETGPRA